MVGRGQRTTCASADPAGTLAAASALAGEFDDLLRRVPGEFDSWWQASRHVPDGPIDVIDIFSGCGGMSAGFRAINGICPSFRNVLAIDIDETSNKTYEQNLNLRPVRMEVHTLAGNLPEVDRVIGLSSRDVRKPLVLIGCAPCQGFSSHRNGARDDRNRLFYDFATIAVHLLPDFIVIENVPELCTDQHWQRVEQVRQLLSSHGYLAHLSIHNFAEFGLPQERFRAILIAAKRPFAPPAGFLSRPEFRTVRDAIGNLPAIEAGVVDPADAMHYTANHRRSTIEMIRTVPLNGGKRSFDTGPNSLISLHARQGKPGFEDVYGRLHWDRPAITITASSRNPASGRFVHPEQHRGLSVREAALLQGFPRSFKFAGGFDHRFQQIGNAVPPLVAASVALTILRSFVQPAGGGPGPGITEPLARSFARLIPSLKGVVGSTSAGPMQNMTEPT